MTAYYNEIDPFAAQWLRNLINAGHITPGIVDERSIEDVYPSDLRGFTQCHFFAGIGVWSHSLRSAGWSDDRPVWTGSCPCQPFSAAGKGAGFDDKRHLWPAFQHLIKECRPAIVLGEQVASKDSDPWIDLVHTDLEALGYAFGAIPFPASSVGAPHIRDRLYWVADTKRERIRSLGRTEDAGTARSLQGANWERKWVRADAGELCGICGLEHARHHHDASEVKAASVGQPEAERSSDQSCRPSVSPGGLADYDSNRCEPGREGCEAMGHGQAAGADRGTGWVVYAEGGRWPGESVRAAASGQEIGAAQGSDLVWPGPTNGFWADADWLLCRDGKWRPVEPGTFPLVDGTPARVGRLRAYGNAVNAKAAQTFIECVMQQNTQPA